MGVNAYFQLIIRPEGVYISLFPPREGGNQLDRLEIIDYLTRNNITYTVGTMKQIDEELTEEIELLLNEMPCEPIHEEMLVNVSADSMQVTARFYPPSIDGRPLEKDDMYNELLLNKIDFGIKDEIIAEYLKNKRYCTDYIMAEGKKMQPGKDAVIEYFFNTSLTPRPSTREDGSVDFYNLNLINHCGEGDVLAKLTREISGVPGNNVYGEILRANDVKRLALKYGRNIELSEDKLTITSKVNGNVVLIEDRVFVSNVLELENVDISTGNIVYDGNVRVIGNVSRGFSINAKGDVEVNGVVEGAYIEAGGHITIAMGMNGMNCGVLKSAGNIVSKFIENATIQAGASVETGSIILSKVYAEDEINVNGKRGYITGGIVCAGKQVSAKTIGSPVGATTEIEVGVNPAMKEQYIQLRKNVEQAKKTLEMVEPNITAIGKKLGQGEKVSKEKMVYIQEQAHLCEKLKKQLELDTNEIYVLEKRMEAETKAQVRVSGNVYPGTKVVISDVSMTVKDIFQYCRFIKSQGEVKMTAL